MAYLLKKFNLNHKSEMKKLLKPFILIFLISFLIINWGRVSWIFNYKTVAGISSQFFHKENQLVESLSDIAPKKDFEYSERENSIEIPKIDVEAPIVLVNSLVQKDLQKGLEKGVIYYPDSVLPGETGQTLILGHSAPPNWPKIKYDWVFSKLGELEKGDKIFIYFNHKKFNYSVSKKFFLKRGEDIPKSLTYSSNVLVLMSCWPPGKDKERIAIRAELID